jgi:hypothetical protein
LTAIIILPLILAALLVDAIRRRTSKPPPTMSSIASKTVHEFITCYDAALDANDVKLVSCNLTADCERTVGPASMVADLKFPAKMTVEQYEGFMAPQMSFLTSHSTDIHSMQVDEVNHTAAYHCTFHVGIKGAQEEQVVENLGILELTEDNTQVKKILVWGDMSVARSS